MNYLYIRLPTVRCVCVDGWLVGLRLFNNSMPNSYMNICAQKWVMCKSRNFEINSLIFLYPYFQKNSCSETLNLIILRFLTNNPNHWTLAYYEAKRVSDATCSWTVLTIEINVSLCSNKKATSDSANWIGLLGEYRCSWLADWLASNVRTHFHSNLGRPRAHGTLDIAQRWFTAKYWLNKEIESGRKKV